MMMIVITVARVLNSLPQGTTASVIIINVISNNHPKQNHGARYIQQNAPNIPEPCSIPTGYLICFVSTFKFLSMMIVE